MLINNEGLSLCNQALVMELIEKLLVEHTDNNPTVDFPPLIRLIKKEDPVQWCHLEKGCKITGREPFTFMFLSDSTSAEQHTREIASSHSLPLDAFFIVQKQITGLWV